MAIMEEKSESSQQPKDENVNITIDDQIQSMKKKLSQYNVEDQKPIVVCNYRIPDNLRKRNEDAYTPRVVSIGPIHHGKPHLQAMERSKWRFLGWYLKRSLVSFDDMVRVAIGIEQEARMFYLESFDNISSQEFSEMIILDFIFVIEFFFKFTSDEHTFPLEETIIVDITHDMILLENQFPQQILARLYQKLYREGNLLCDLIIEYFHSIQTEFCIVRAKDWESATWDNATDMVDFLVKCLAGQTNDCESFRPLIDRIQSATELQEAGVKILKVVNTNFLLDVKFGNGTLEIPVINVGNRTETLFRNMIASEHSMRDRPKIGTAYGFLMSQLIRSPKDVVLLKNCGIIQTRLQDDEKVTRLFANLVKGIAIKTAHFYFADLYTELNAYSTNYWHRLKGSWFKWIRILRRDYFNSPWTIISFIIAASILLILTVIQTTCAIIQI